MLILRLLEAATPAEKQDGKNDLVRIVDSLAIIKMVLALWKTSQSRGQRAELWEIAFGAQSFSLQLEKADSRPLFMLF